MKSTPVAYISLKYEIQLAKAYLPDLHQIDINMVFNSARPSSITKMVISVARQLHANHHDVEALSLLYTAKLALKNQPYHNYLVHKTWCIDKLLECESEINRNRYYQTAKAGVSGSQPIHHANRAPAIPQQKHTSSVTNHNHDNTTLLVNQMMMASIANQTINEAHEHGHDSHDANCPSPTFGEQHYSHHEQQTQPDASYRSHTTLSQGQDTSGYHSSLSSNDNQHNNYSDMTNSIYHGSSTMFDSSSHSHNSNHDYGSSSSHDYSSSTSHDTSSSNDYSNSFGM